MDEGNTGRFELTVYKGQTNAFEGEGELCHSKAQSGQFPDMETLKQMIASAIE